MRSSARWPITWRDVHGVGAGDRVGVFAMRNYPSGCSPTGRSCRSVLRGVGMNVWWTTEEMRYGLADGGT